ncbi:3-mercaptopyruvate sulfurtransferase [Flexibacterium corallicola]|uniref:3-mercaptopyruvate sulfurtransferase n=1 Tax=Flexibacterium corallicola TaxID=3037259 RepID=UPI00286EF29A|nr:3-mercaptopyruvate sulfurtransferase [Pseudovibrio sp. M1P-2-3]
MTTSCMVTTQWLEDHLGAPDLVVLDASYYLPAMNRDAKQEYDEAHIPGALYFDIDQHSDKNSPLPHMLPEAHVFSSAMRKMGIGDGMTIVVYDGMGLFSAARVWWMFRIFGVEQVFVLDGGLPKWTQENRPLTSQIRQRNTRHFTARKNNLLVSDMAHVQRALSEGCCTVLDARSQDRFEGQVPEAREGLRAGHMPGAKNLPFGQLLKPTGELEDPATLQAIFAEFDIDINTNVITTCGSGVTASVISLALAQIGHKQVSVYDGSWTEWGGHPETDVATGPA